MAKATEYWQQVTQPCEGRVTQVALGQWYPPSTEGSLCLLLCCPHPRPQSRSGRCLMPQQKPEASTHHPPGLKKNGLPLGSGQLPSGDSLHPSLTWHSPLTAPAPGCLGTAGSSC